MLRGMVFVDHMNFDASIRNYYSSINATYPRLDYSCLFKNIVNLTENVDYIKTYAFIPKPDDFLKKDKNILNYYEWATNLRNGSYFDIIEGNLYARPIDYNIEMKVEDKSTYYKVEKGTDVNLAIYALNQGFHNAYDVAYVVSGDTDYIEMYETLKRIGKLVTVVVVQGQITGKIKSHVDNVITLDKNFFNKCLRKN